MKPPNKRKIELRCNNLNADNMNKIEIKFESRFCYNELGILDKKKTVANGGNTNIYSVRDSDILKDHRHMYLFGNK